MVKFFDGSQLPEPENVTLSLKNTFGLIRTNCCHSVNAALVVCEKKKKREKKRKKEAQEVDAFSSRESETPPLSHNLLLRCAIAWAVMYC